MKSEELINLWGYEYCEEHDQHYKQYCSGCALGMPSIKELEAGK